MQRQILNEEFWVRVRAIVIAVTPFYRTLRMTDMEGATMGLLVHFMREARKELEACTLLTLEELVDLLHIVDSRYEFMRRPIHVLAALLHPAYKSPILATDNELLGDRDKLLPKLLPPESHE